MIMRFSSVGFLPNTLELDFRLPAKALGRNLVDGCLIINPFSYSYYTHYWSTCNRASINHHTSSTDISIGVSWFEEKKFDDSWPAVTIISLHLVTKLKHFPWLVVLRPPQFPPYWWGTSTCPLIIKHYQQWVEATFNDRTN